MLLPVLVLCAVFLLSCHHTTAEDISSNSTITPSTFVRVDLGNVAIRKAALRQYPSSVDSSRPVNRKKVLPLFQEGTKCSEETASRISNAFVKAKYDRSSCPKEDWLVAMALADTPGKKIFINIGVNKGYNLAIWMNVFTPWNQIDAKLWKDELLIEQPLLGSDACGVCGDCETSFPTEILTEIEQKRIRENQKLTLIAVDLNGKNLQSIEHILRRIEQKATKPLHSASVYTYHAAVSDKVGIISIPNCYLGNEACSMSKVVSNRIGKGFVDVNTITVDQLIKELIPVYRKPTRTSSGGKEEQDFVEEEEEDADSSAAGRRLQANNYDQNPFEIRKKRSGRSGSNKQRTRQQRPSFEQSDQSRNQLRGGKKATDNDNNKIDYDNSTLILRQHNLPRFVPGPRVDILMIDIEGYDAYALRGSINQLATRNVRCLIFEYHSFHPWNTIPLGPIIESLDVYGYDCYFQGTGRLWKVTGCFTYDYDFHQWSNIMCLVRGEVWHEAIQQFVQH